MAFLVLFLSDFKIAHFVLKKGALFLLILLTACTSLQKKDTDLGQSTVHPQDIQLFERAFQDLGAGNYKTVIPQFKKLAEKYKGQNLEWPTLYNLASAYKEIGHCAKAKDIYERLRTKIAPPSGSQQLKLKTTNPQGEMPFPLRIKSQLALSLSYAYECLGKRNKSLIALKEGEPYIHHLTEEVRLIEYPARLSLAYIEMEKIPTGLKIQKQLYQNLESFKKTFRISQAADENFARYFYTIGRSHIKPAYVPLSRFLKVVPFHQAYLVQAVLLNTGQWSVRAEKELGDLYRKIWVGLKTQKNRKIHQKEVKKVLNQLKQMGKEAKTKKISHIYRILRKKTLRHLKS